MSEIKISKTAVLESMRIWWGGFEWMVNLFLMLTPFTIAFALVGEFVKNYRSRYSLK